MKALWWWIAARGSAPPGWIVVASGEGDAPRWEVVGDPGSAAGDNVLAQLAMDRNFRRYPLAIYSGVKMTDGRLAVRFKPIAGGAAKAAGLVWRYQDENNYYVVRADALRENVSLFKVQNGPLPVEPRERADGVAKAAAREQAPPA